ncbi:MAG: MauE/DoxX family redox-associated membrane protein [Actinomycetota bacterium]
MQSLFHLSAALLVLSGGAKLTDPAPTAGALRVAALPSGRTAVYALALLELALGGSGLLYGGRPWGYLSAGLYIGFLGFVILARLRRLPIESCGCFGRADTPPTTAHLVINLAAAGIGIWAGAGSSPSLVDVLADQPLGGVPYLGFLAVGTFCLYLMMTALARLQSA